MRPYEPTYALAALGEHQPDVGLSMRTMYHLVWCLVQCNREWLRTHPETPLLINSGVVYDRMTPPVGDSCGDDKWQDIATTLALRKGDCDDLAAWRCAELIERFGVDAEPMVMLRVTETPTKISHVYHILVKWPHVLPKGMTYPATVYWEPNKACYVEDPSRDRGMLKVG